MDQKGEKSFWEKPIVQWVGSIIILLSIISSCTGTKHGHFNKDGDPTGVDSATADLY